MRYGTLTTIKAKLTCPECQAIVITSMPESIVLEKCISCRSHTWDIYDIMIAETADDARISGRSVRIM